MNKSEKWLVRQGWHFEIHYLPPFMTGAWTGRWSNVKQVEPCGFETFAFSLSIFFPKYIYIGLPRLMSHVWVDGTEAAIKYVFNFYRFIGSNTMECSV